MDSATSSHRLQNSKGQEGNAVRCPVGQLDGKSYQEWVVRLPIKHQGWGFRSLAEMCGPAYLGALETAIPFMTSRDRLCPERENEWGGEECWGENAPTDDRWRVVLSSGCQEGSEMARVWKRLQEEARGAAEWLGVETKAVFASSLEVLGAGSYQWGNQGRSS